MKRNYIPLEISIPQCIGRVHIGDLHVSAHYNKAGEFDLLWIKWQGTDIYLMLQAAGEAGQPMIDMCKDALRNNLDSLSPFDRWQLENKGNVLISQPGMYGNEDHDEFNDRLMTWADAMAQTPEPENA